MGSPTVLVSIIMPVYNVENYLEQSLMAVANQTFRDYEFIIINDGSTDNSDNIIKSFINQHDNLNINYLVQKNEGQSSARNKGINVAQGKYIYFFDSDDLIKENAIELLYKKSINNNLNLLLFSGETFVEAKETSTTKYKFNYQKNKNYLQIMNGKETFIQLIKNDEYSTSPCLYFIKRDVLKVNKIKFYEGIIHEDALFTFQLILSTDRIKVIQDTFFYRRIRPNSTMTARNATESFLGNYTVLIEMLIFQSNISEKDNELMKAIINRLSDAFGNAINQYIYMSKSDQKKYIENIMHLKKINEKYSYFNRKDYWLFNKQPSIYAVLKRSYDLIK